MDSIEFLKVYFAKLTEKDFNAYPETLAFYNYFKRASKSDMFSCFIDFITRNKEFDNAIERNKYLDKLYKTLANDIITYKPSENADDDGPVKKVMGPTRGGTAENRMLKEQAEQAGIPWVQYGLKTGPPAKQSDKLILNKEASLNVLRRYICDSSVIIYEPPPQTDVIEEDTFRDDIAHIIEADINEDGRKMPTGTKNTELSKRILRMNVWRDTEEKCKNLCKDAQMMQSLSKIYHIDLSLFSARRSYVMTMPDSTNGDDDTAKNSKMPVIQLDAVYSNMTYKTIIRVLNSDPVFEAKIRPKSAYICAGSGMVQGGNADQGLDVVESRLYLTTTYSIGLSNALHSYPLNKNYVLVCPNVLVFKDLSYNTVQLNDYKRISVICAPSPWRPKLSNPNMPDLSNIDGFDYLYDSNTKYTLIEKYNFVKQNLYNTFELALFRGYDTIILDDRGITDNVLPCHDTAIIMRDVINMFKGRFCEIVIAITNPQIYKIYRQYIF
jgi:hypothetical protein